ncbi:MAG: 30S ribosomal protein S1 [Nitrospirota bacterium]
MDVDKRERIESHEDIQRLYEESFKSIKEGTIVKGKIIQVLQDGVVVDVGYKSEGIIPLQEFQKEELERLSLGSEIDVYIEEWEDAEGNMILSKERANKIKVWEDLTGVCEKGGIVEGKIVAKVKGGMSVDVCGVKAFLPNSHIDVKPPRNIDSLVGKVYQMKVLQVNQRKGNIVLSRRAVLEEEKEKRREETLARLKEGAILKGIVKNITEYGVFIDIGGIDGLLHITDISWGRINHPSEVFMVGDSVKVVVLKYDRVNQRVSLGYKQLTPNPWAEIEQKYPIGKKIKGRVVNITDYGAFVELEEGVEGLIHVSDMSWTQKIKHPSKIVAISDVIEAMVLNIEKENKKIALGMKQIEPNPWETIIEKYKVGQKIEGRIRNMTEFGAFVGLEEGIDGLIHISDISWTKHLKHPSEVLKKGQKVETVVLGIDRDKERISLGLKQLTPDPWEDEIPEKFKVGDAVTGKVVKITDFGIFVEFEEGVEGLIYSSEIDKEPSQKIEDIANLGDKITARIIKVDTSERKIGLSLRAYQKGTGKKKAGK